jgi:inhibitor of KinA
VRISPLGDTALLVHLGSTIDEATHRRVRAVHARLASRRIPGLIELVPAYASVAVHYDPERVAAAAPSSESPYHHLVALLSAALEDLREDEMTTPRTVEIPVCYGGVHGPDLEEVAHQHRLSPLDVVELHARGTYVVYMLGFAPGFAYLGGLPPELATPRRADPRTAVPAGSVGIGGSQTGVYPLTLPGGWQLIGRTPLRLFDPARTPPSLLDVGDRVRFRALAPDECTSWPPAA